MVTTACANLTLYQKKIKLLSAQIQQTARCSKNITLKKNSSNLFRHRRKQIHHTQIDVRNFNHIIFIDQENLIAIAEGMVTYENLVTAALQYGLLPPVVPELKSITIGGALSGIGVESASFRYGLVHETIIQFDVLLPDGRVLDCQPNNEHSDLFYAFPNSYGTLGYALKVSLRLIPVKKYIKLQYHHFSESNKFFNTLHQLCTTHRSAGQIAFIDGVIFDETHQVLITGEMTEQAPYHSNYQYLKIYYQAVKNKQEDYLTTENYIWRWDADWFWCSKVFYMQNRVLRFLLGKWLLKSTVYTKIMRFLKRNIIVRWLMRQFEKHTESVIQDVAIPMHQAENYLTFFQKNIGIKPIWICPIHPFQAQAQYPLFKMQPNQLYVNFGFWDNVKSDQPAGYYNRLIEQKVLELGGNKSLYSNAFYTPEEFWKIYNKDYYQTLKNKYDPANKLNSLYKKCIEKL